MSFFDWYFGLVGDKTEEFVLCPFPHQLLSGTEYYESRPSAQVNTVKNLFHCKTCGVGMNDTQFIQHMLGTSIANAKKLDVAFSKNIYSVSTWTTEPLHTKNIPLADSLGITKEVQDLLMMRRQDDEQSLDSMRFPVFMYDKLMDVRTYRLNCDPKVRSIPGAVNGLIVPFDIWRQTPKDRWTLICAGEKDMAVARSNGFNAITVTGGEAMSPITLKEFEGRLVAIVYDNDEAGRRGAVRLALTLLKAKAFVKVITGFHEGMSDKEDITDFFNKYNRSRADLINYIETTNFFIPADGDVLVPKIILNQAVLEKYAGRLVRSDVQVIAIGDDQYPVPKMLSAYKYAHSDAQHQYMQQGDSQYWELDEETCADVLHLMDSGLTVKKLEDNYYKLLKVYSTERNVRVTKHGTATVYKAFVADACETSNPQAISSSEYQVYSIDHPLESGKKYTLTYRMVPHPYKAQEFCMVVVNAEQASDSVTNFKITDSVKASLKVFSDVVSDLGVSQAMTHFAERIKGLLKYDGNNQLITTLDLSYHTPLYFNMGQFQNIRAYLDTLVVGESRVGKSSTAETLRNLYGLGLFVSLAGNSATIPGLVGGSHRLNNTNHTKAGLIPQNHKGLVIFEEFGKCRGDVIAELTDIRSSNIVRINRVAGSLTLPCMVRMVTLSNVKHTGKAIKSIASYPYGLDVVVELVGSAEDIARYDIMLVLSDRGSTHVDPYWTPLEPFETKAYQDRVRWVWSRDASEIIIDDSVGYTITVKANELNAMYDSHIKVFGTEAWKKLARVAIAVAGMCASTDDTCEKLIVRNEHVLYAADYLQKLYDNPTFRLKEYVEHERKYSTIDDDGVAALQRIYLTAPAAMLHLDREHSTNKNMLGMAAGLDNDKLNSVTNALFQGMFIRLNGTEIVPTERFRLGMSKIDRNIVLARVGETR